MFWFESKFSQNIGILTHWTVTIKIDTWVNPGHIIKSESVEFFFRSVRVNNKVVSKKEFAEGSIRVEVITKRSNRLECLAFGRFSEKSNEASILFGGSK